MACLPQNKCAFIWQNNPLQPLSPLLLLLHRPKINCQAITLFRFLDFLELYIDTKVPFFVSIICTRKTIPHNESQCSTIMWLFLALRGGWNRGAYNWCLSLCLSWILYGSLLRAGTVRLNFELGECLYLIKRTNDFILLARLIIFVIKLLELEI